MARLISTFLRALADFAETADCERPCDAFETLLQQKGNIPKEELTDLKMDILKIKGAIGDLDKRLEELEEDKPKTKAKLIPFNL